MHDYDIIKGLYTQLNASRIDVDLSNEVCEFYRLVDVKSNEVSHNMAEIVFEICVKNKSRKYYLISRTIGKLLGIYRANELIYALKNRYDSFVCGIVYSKNLSHVTGIILLGGVTSVLLRVDSQDDIPIDFTLVPLKIGDETMWDGWDNFMKNIAEGIGMGETNIERLAPLAAYAESIEELYTYIMVDKEGKM